MFGTSPRPDLAPNDHPLPLTKLRVNTHYLRGPRPFRSQLAEIMSFDPRLDLQLGKRSQRVKLNRLAATFHRRVV
jgi:hypothetical protein